MNDSKYTVHIYIDTQKFMQDGHPIYQADSDVYLIENSIPSWYFHEIRHYSPPEVNVITRRQARLQQNTEDQPLQTSYKPLS